MMKLITLILLILFLTHCNMFVSYPEIKTPDGTIVIKKVERTDRLGSGPSASTPSPGLQYLILWIDIKYGIPSKEANNDPYNLKGVCVISKDGTRTDPSGHGMWYGKPLIIFTPSVSARGFKLYWPGNAPIDL